MTPEKVCQMIDTIYEGEPYSLEIKGVGGSVCGGDDLRITVTPEYVTVMSTDLLTTCDITDPRQAREIAAALVAWADHKEADAEGATSVAAARFLFEIARVRMTQAKSHPEV